MADYHTTKEMQDAAELASDSLHAFYRASIGIGDARAVKHDLFDHAVGGFLASDVDRDEIAKLELAVAFLAVTLRRVREALTEENYMVSISHEDD